MTTFFVGDLNVTNRNGPMNKMHSVMTFLTFRFELFQLYVE